MSVKRRNHSQEFKFRTALEAAKEQKTISQLASELNLHPNQISNWKKHLSGDTPETPNPKQNAKKRKEGKKSNHALLGRYILPKLYFYSTKCNGCGICQSKCPVKAIKMVGNRSYWTFRCESCQRCINFCPNKAVQASLPYLILVMLAFSTIYDKWISQKLYSVIASTGDFAGIISFIILNVLCALFLYITYPLLHMLLRIRFINVILAYTSITRYENSGF